LNINHAYREIVEELERAEKLHPNWPKDIVYQIATMCEEAGEALKATLDYKYGKGPSDDIIKEVIQTAAMCLRFLKNERL
jgi:hypothetical protein